MEILFFPTNVEREKRPKVSYDVKDGAVENIFYLPLANVIMLSALITEVGKQGKSGIAGTQSCSHFRQVATESICYEAAVCFIIVCF